jgi:riboflavin synthase
MFTGIIEEQGIIKEIEKQGNLWTLTLEASDVIKGTCIGDSIALDGVCLTVVRRRGRLLTFEVMKETICATTISGYACGDKVNCERALKAGGRIGGHFVSGHVDGVGDIRRIIRLADHVEYHVRAPQSLRRYLTPKGSVCLDGISLTVGRVTKTGFSVYLIPYTLARTTFGHKTAGDRINIETDILAKYVVNGKGEKP